MHLCLKKLHRAIIFIIMNSEVYRIQNPVPAARVFRGFTPQEWERAYARDLTDFERNIGNEFPGGLSIDKLLEKQVRRDTSGTIVVVDFGAGDGKLTEEFLTDQTVGKRTRGVLKGKAKQDTSIIFWGINDSPHPFNHLCERDILPERDDPLKERVRGKEVSYSITSSQTMQRFFESKDIDGVDLVVASNSVSYLTPPVFEKFTDDVVRVLKPGGHCIAYGYGEIAGERYKY